MKNYPKFIQDGYKRQNLFKKIEMRLWLFYHTRITKKMGWTELEYRAIPIIKD